MPYVGIATIGRKKIFFHGIKFSQLREELYITEMLKYTARCHGGWEVLIYTQRARFTKETSFLVSIQFWNLCMKTDYWSFKKALAKE